MPKRDFEFFVIDMLVSLNTIQRKMKCIANFEELVQNEDTWLIVTRSLEIVGEAMKSILECKNIDRSLINPEWRYVIDFRNIVAHEYFGLNAEQVFDITTNDVPELEAQILNFVKKLSQKEKFNLVINQAIIDLEKTNRSQSIEYLKSINPKI